MHCGGDRRHIHPACAVDYSEWSGKVGEPGGYYDNRDILRGALLCCKCFDDHLPYVWADDPDHNPDVDIRETRESELPWWITEVDLPSPPSVPPPEPHSPPPPPPAQDPSQLPSSMPEIPPPSPERCRDAPTASPDNAPLRSPRRDDNPQPLKSRRPHAAAPHPAPHEVGDEASAREAVLTEPNPLQTEDADPPAPPPSSGATTPPSASSTTSDARLGHNDDQCSRRGTGS